MKKIPFIILEIVVIISLLAGLTYWGINKYNESYNHFPKYTVSFSDIDGLSIGSPVKFAGVHVGHVLEQKLKDNKVLVTFKIVDQDVDIPKGSRAGVEFTGMAGSRSLEIIPPETESSKGTRIAPIDPLRVNNLKEIFNMLAEATVNFSKGLYIFLNKNGDQANGTLKKASEYLEEKTVQLESTGEKIKQEGPKIAEQTKKIKEVMSETSENIEAVRNTIDTLATSEEVRNNFKKLQKSTGNLAEMINTGEANQKVEELNSKIQDFNVKVKQLNQSINKVKDREIGYIREFNESLQTTAKKMQEFIESGEKNSEPAEEGKNKSL